MTITDAINKADTEHVVYFLLVAYVEALGYTGRAQVPGPITRLPIVDPDDVDERLYALRGELESSEIARPDAMTLIAEAVDVFAAASERLNKLTGQRVAPRLSPSVAQARTHAAAASLRRAR